VIDTALPSPDDIVAEDAGPEILPGSAYPVAAHSLVVYVSEA
jgi:hypothetical protein